MALNPLSIENITPRDEAMYYVGFDVSKTKLNWSLINHQGIEIAFGIVPNDEAELAKLLLTLAGAYPSECMRAVVESTGCYHYPLLYASQAVNMPCLVYNPILTKQQIKTSVRGKKTDRSDAYLVARVGWSGGGRLHTPEPHPDTRHYARSVQKLSQLGSTFQLHHTHLREQLADNLSHELTDLLNGIQTSITQAKRQMYRDLAASAQGDEFRLLQTIPGIGPFVAASVIGEVQDIQRFKSRKQFTAYMGLDPKIRQSGHTLNNTGRLTKRGSSHLRHSMFIAANVARRYDPQFKALYDKKRAEGKCYTVATCAVARKMGEVVYAVWWHGEQYELPSCN
jgi:transposase